MCLPPSLSVFYALYHTHTGVWVGKVLDDMLAEVENPQQNMKLYLYSAVSLPVSAFTLLLFYSHNYIIIFILCAILASFLSLCLHNYCK